MKYFFLIFFTFLNLLFFSCRGTPKNNNQQLPYQYPSDENAEEIMKSAVPEDFSLTSAEFFSDVYFDNNESMEITQTETDDEAENDEISSDIMADINEEEIEETEPYVEFAAEDSETEEVPQELEVTQAPAEQQLQPPVQQEIFVPAPAQTQPPAAVQPSEQTQPPQQTEPMQSPAQTQPHVPPSALLGSAEERFPIERQNIIEEPLRDFSLGEASAPVQTMTIPQDSPNTQNLQGGEITFSRIVRATVGQIIEIPFRGTGWVYLGELASRRGIVYDSRRLDSDGQSFIFRAEEAGTYALKFFRQDFIRDYILNDHVQVIVGEAPDAGGAGWFNPPIDRGRVTAEPRWPSPLEEAELQRTGSISPLGATYADASSQPSSAGQIPSVSQQLPDIQSSSDTQSQFATQLAPNAISSQSTNNTPVSSEGIASLFTPAEQTPPEQSSAVQPSSDMQPETVENIEILPPDVLLQRAKENFEAGNVSGAIALLDQLGKYYPYGNDELYWLYGQLYEANTPSRNILLSLDYYQRLVNEFPQSNYYNDARARIAYIERFYIHIR